MQDERIRNLEEEVATLKHVVRALVPERFVGAWFDAKEDN